MAHRSFAVKTEEQEQDPIDPITFDLSTETDLAVRSNVNGKLLLGVMGKVESGNVTRQAEGIVEVFSIVMLREDGENPEGYTGKLYDPEAPNRHHTTAELRTALEEDVTPGIDPTSSLGRLNRILDDPNTEIEISELAELVGWIVSEITGRPTKKSSGSGPGGRSTKATSPRKRQPRVLTSVGSEPDSQ